MPRVETKTKGGGKERNCNVCGRIIPKGERYHTYAFRYGGRRFHCADHFPKRSQLTQSKLATVYAAIEAAEENLGDIDTTEAAEEALTQVAEAAREVADEYREAAEAMGGAGSENEERADELEGFADELESPSFSADPEAAVEEETQTKADWDENEEGEEWDEDASIERINDVREALREEVQEYLNNCPV